MLIESMRDLGYSLETALADIIDNSIAAGADSIEIFSDPSDDTPRIAVVDNGHGMTEAELLDAMRAGSQNPLASRKAHDLGRFGLGLKTASFSQCRRLTVITKRAGKMSAAIWDLDHVAKTDRWEVLIPTDPSKLPLSSKLSGDGTIVAWEQMDRLHGGLGSGLLVRRLSEAATHLELVFHRFLSGELGQRKIKMFLNNTPLKPLDPFASSHKSTQKLEAEILTIHGHPVTIQAFTLPHFSKLKSKDEWDRLAGEAGHIRNQGFYLYRERRLIIWGTWLGLARHRPLTNLSRVRIDMPKELDAEWKIDVKKASAQPPAILRDRLRQLVDKIGASSKRVYTHKGKKLNIDGRLDVWSRVQDKGEIKYHFNTEHPSFTSLMDALPEAQRPRLRALVQIMESMLPFDSIFADRGGDPKAIVANVVADESLAVLAKDTYQQLNGGTDRSAKILDMMAMCEPFSARWQDTLRILETAFAWES
jgi:hypothetical protein